MTRDANLRSIDKGFAWLSSGKDALIRTRLAQLLEYGLDAVLDAHDVFGTVHHHNIDESESVGWAIYHDGVEVASGTNDGGPVEGAVLFRLEELGYRTSGWVGFVMSETDKPWYRVDWEMDFMNYSVEEVKQNFRNIFKPIR